jgi:hemoglobin/transferrin/lactoferrin receptor protein
MVGNSGRMRALICGVSAISLGASTLATPVAAQTVLLDAITIIATKTEELAIDALAPVSTVRRNDIQQIMPGRTSDIFFGVPGVTFQQRGDDPATAINIRGLQDFGRVAVLIDGARQNHQRTGHSADGLFYLDPGVIAGVDILRGPTANIYGSGAIGGVVTFRTMDVQDVLAPGQTWGTLHNIELGTNRGRFNTQTFLAARPNPNVDFIIGGSFRRQDSYFDAQDRLWPYTENDIGTGLAKIAFRPADGHEIKFNGLVSQFDFFNGQPVTPTSTIYAAKVVNTIAGVRWKYNRPDDRVWDIDVNAYHTQTDAAFTKFIGTTGSPVNGSPGDQRAFVINTFGIDANNTSRFDTGALRHAFTYGVDVFNDAVNVRDPVGTADLFTPSGERTVGGSFFQLKTNYSTWLEVISAVRYDTYTLSGGNTGSSGDRLSPKLTIGVTPVTGIQPYVTYAEGYRAPAITEVFVAGQHPNLGPGSNFVFMQNAALRPEIGKNQEVGVNFKFDNIFRPGDAFRAKANLFRNNVEDFIELVRVASGALGQDGSVCTGPVIAACLQYQNLTQAQIEGFEFESRYDTGLWYVAVAGQHIRGRNALTLAPLLRIQPDQIATTVGVRLLEQRLHLAVRWAAVAAKSRDEIPPVAGTPTYPPVGSYNLVNLYLGYQLGPNATLNFAIENILNEQYARYMDVFPGAGQVNTAFPSAGIVYKAGLTMRFGDTVPTLASATLAAR